MSSLGAPNVCGPITVKSTAIKVDGPFKGSEVELLVNGVSRVTVTATSTTSFLSVAGINLMGGDKIQARWTFAGEVSDPTPIPEIVLPEPKALSPLVFKSQVHDHVDWIILGGAYPGAKIELLDGGTVIGTAFADQETISVRVTGNPTFGAKLSAVQTVDTPSGQIQSKPTPSLPVGRSPAPERSLHAPVLGPIPDCAEGVPIFGILQGASTQLQTGSGVLSFPFNAESILGLINREAHPPEVFSVLQRFERVSLTSPQSTPPAGVETSIPIGKPSINQANISCPAAQKIKVSNLTSGATLIFKLVTSGGTAATRIRQIGVPQGEHTAEFWLPDLSGLIPQNPPFPALVVVQEKCGKSAESDPVYFNQYSGSMFPPAIVTPITECSHWVLVRANHATVRLYSDQPDTPALSEPVYLYGDGWVQTYRGLRGGEFVSVKLEATCQPPDLRTSAEVRVEDLSSLPEPQVMTPARVYHRYVWLEKVIPGAQVHVFVNDKWRTTVDATGMNSSVLMVYVGQLRVEDSITAVQALCTKISQPTNPPVIVQFGKMKLTPKPGSLTQGKAGLLEIEARNVDNNSPVTAIVSRGGSVVGKTNTPFAVSPAMNESSLTFSIAADGFVTETITIPAIAPPAVQPPTFTFRLQIGFTATKKVIKKIEWTLLGPNNSLDSNEKPNKSDSVLTFTPPNPPSNSFHRYTVGCSVEFEYEALNAIQGLNGTRVCSFITGGLSQPAPGKIHLDWFGKNSTANFSLIWDSQSDQFLIMFSQMTSP